MLINLSTRFTERARSPFAFNMNYGFKAFVLRSSRSLIVWYNLSMQSVLPLDLVRNINVNITESDITPLKGGYSSQAYKVESEGESYVLLVQRDGAVTVSKYGHSFVILKILEAAGYPYTPKPVWLHPDKTAMIISFFEGQASDVFDFKGFNVDQRSLSLRVIDAILDTATIPRSEYDALCREYSVEPTAVITAKDLAKEIGTDWFVSIEKYCPDRNIVDWLRPRVLSSVEYANSIVSSNPTLGLGDPSSPNILINKTGDFMLIDWDSSSYNTEGPEYYISYTTHLTDFMKPFQKEIITHVAKRVGIPPAELAQKVFEYSRYYQVFDINWAAMMMAKVTVGEVQGNIDEFRQIANDRIFDYEKSFESE